LLDELPIRRPSAVVSSVSLFSACPTLSIRSARTTRDPAGAARSLDCGSPDVTNEWASEAAEGREVRGAGWKLRASAEQIEAFDVVRRNVDREHDEFTAAEQVVATAGEPGYSTGTGFWGEQGAPQEK
jgi:hypothetical protein